VSDLEVDASDYERPPRKPKALAHWLPMRLPSTANLREHWAVRAKRTAAHRAAGLLVSKTAGMRLPVVVTLTRIAPRELDDDNLASAFKAFRDGVAEGLGFGGDRVPGLAWHYQQEKGKTPTVKVVIEEVRP
jgi:hypothetical protein